MEYKFNYTIDTETRASNIDINNKETSVWLVDICECGTYKHYTISSFEGMIKLIYTGEIKTPCRMWFHNLKFDGNFLLPYLMKQGYEEVYHNKKLGKKQFRTLISDKGVWYSTTVKFPSKLKESNSGQVEFCDSLKKINSSVADIARGFDLPILKGEIDYTKYRPEGYIATEEEIAYIHNDTEIVARALDYMFELGMTALTVATDALNEFKKLLGGEPNYRFHYPKLDIKVDDYIRKAYKGGACLVNPIHKGVDINNPVYCYDKNSMYPSVMFTKMLPVGYPLYYNKNKPQNCIIQGKYEYSDNYPLFIQRINVSCKVKEGHFPCILDRKYSNKGKVTYIEDTKGEEVELTLCTPCFNALLEHYDIENIEYLDYMAFQATDKIFEKFIEKWYNVKETEKRKIDNNEKGNKPLMQIAKLMLNSLYGKFATKPQRRKCNVMLNEYDILRTVIEESESIIDPEYTALGAFITSYAREDLFNFIHKFPKEFVYSDTDSVHLIGITPDKLSDMFIDHYKINAWDLEKCYVKSRYLAQKTYMGLKDNGNIDKKIAGCPNECKKSFNFDNFYFGTTVDGKKMPKKMKGGVILVDTTFTLKER